MDNNYNLIETFHPAATLLCKFNYGVVIVGSPYSGKSTLLRLIRKADLLDLLTGKAKPSSSSSLGSSGPITSLITGFPIPSNESTSYGYQFQLKVLQTCLKTMQLILNELKLNQHNHSVHGYSSASKASEMLGSSSLGSEYADIKNTFGRQVEIIEENSIWDSLLDTHRVNGMIDNLSTIWMIPAIKSTYQRLLDCGYFTPFFQFSNDKYGYAQSNPNIRGENIADLLDNLSFIMKRPITIQGSEKDMKNGSIKIVEYLLKTYLEDRFFAPDISNPQNDKHITENREQGVKYGKFSWGIKTEPRVYNLAQSYHTKSAPVVLFLVPLSDIDKKKSKRTTFVTDYLEKFYTTLTDPGTQKVLVFTKADIFSKRISSGSIDVQSIFPDFVGNSTDPLRVFEHFFSKFWILCRKYHEVVPYYVVNLVDMEENVLFLRALLESGSPYHGKSFLSKQILKATDNLTKTRLKYHIQSNIGHFSDVSIVIDE